MFSFWTTAPKYLLWIQRRMYLNLRSQLETLKWIWLEQLMFLQWWVLHFCLGVSVTCVIPTSLLLHTASPFVVDKDDWRTREAVYIKIDAAFILGLNCCGFFCYIPSSPNTSVASVFHSLSESWQFGDEQRSGLLAFHDKTKLGIYWNQIHRRNSDILMCFCCCFQSKFQKLPQSLHHKLKKIIQEGFQMPVNEKVLPTTMKTALKFCLRWDCRGRTLFFDLTQGRQLKNKQIQSSYTLQGKVDSTEILAGCVTKPLLLVLVYTL